MAKKSIVTLQQEIYDESNVRTDYVKKTSQISLSDFSHQLLQIAPGVVLQEVAMPAIPSEGVAIFTDQPLVMKLIDSINCPDIPLTSYFVLNTSISNIYLTNSGTETANVEIFVLNEA